MASLFYPNCLAALQVILDGQGPDAADSDPVIVSVRPRTATIHRNSYRQADSYEFTFDATDLPFDPRTIRAGQTDVWLYQSPSLEQPFVPKVQPVTRTPMETLAANVGQGATTDDGGGVNGLGRPLISGLFDRANLEMSDDGRWFSINGQDYTAHLASIQWKPESDGRARRIPTGKRVDLLIADLLAEADPTGKLQLVKRGLADDQLQIVDAALVGGARPITIEQNTSYWDVMWELALRSSLIIFVDGLDIVLTRPKEINYQDTQLVKRLVWGANLESLKLERNLGKRQAPTVVIYGYDPKARKHFSVEFPSNTVTTAKPIKASGTHTKQSSVVKIRHAPPKPQTKGKVTTTLRKRDEYIELAAPPGVTDRAVLMQMAENAYYDLGQGEHRVIAKTRDLHLPTGAGGVASALDLATGDAIVLDWLDFDAQAITRTDIAEATKVANLVARGYPERIAERVVQYYSKLVALDRPLRVKEATYTWDVNDGISIEVEIQDFIVGDGIRSDSGAPQTSALDAMRSSTVDRHGNPIGRSPAQVKAAARRFSR